MSLAHPTKEQKLKHYAGRELVAFVQLDGFKLEGWDDVMKPDENGHSIMGGLTYELMSGGCPVRVLVKTDAQKEDVVALLEKILDWVKKDALELGSKHLPSGLPDISRMKITLEDGEPRISLRDESSDGSDDEPPDIPF